MRTQLLEFRTPNDIVERGGAPMLGARDFRDFEHLLDAPRPLRHDDDSVGEEHRLLNAVRDKEHCRALRLPNAD